MSRSKGLFILAVLFVIFVGISYFDLDRNLLGLGSGLILANGIPIGTGFMGSNLGYGRIASHHPNTFIQSKIAEGAILFGRAVQIGTARTQGKLVDGALGEFLGVSMYSISASNLDNDGYLDKDIVGIGSSGYMTVFVEEAVNAGDSVRIRHTDHASDVTKVKGNFCKTAEAGKTYLLDGANFEKTIGVAGETVIFLFEYKKIIADV